MSWLGGLFGTEKAVDSLLDKDKGLLVRAGGWVDGLNHTEQEKAEHRLLVEELGITRLNALHPFRVTQRILALGVISLWLIVGINVLGAIWYDAVSPGANVSEAMLKFAMSDYVFWPVVAVLSLYVGGGVIPKKEK